VPIYLIRHAHAGSRSAWVGNDADRPISDKGSRQVDHLGGLLVGSPVGQVWSSPFLRCVQTVEPLAAERKLEVRRANELAEGADGDAMLTWLLERADANPAACTHGDIIPKVVRSLLAHGMKADVGALSQKGSMWVLDVRKGKITRGTYHPPMS